MKSSTRKLQLLSRLVLAAVLFAQGILAAHACLQPVASAIPSLLNEHAAETTHCHESAKAKLNANECLMHCTQSDQINFDHAVVAALPANEVILHIAIPPLLHKALTFDYVPLVLDTGPPLSILYCSFLI
jgi:hypothetical protein